MKGLLVASLCIAAFCLVRSMPTQEEVKKAQSECATKYGLSMENGQLVTPGEEPSKEALCVIGCSANMLESDEGDIQVAMDELGDKLTPEQKEQFSGCLKQITVTEDCDLGAAALACAKALIPS